MTDSAADRWDRRHLARTPRTEPAGFVVAAARWLTPGARVVDVAGGTGRNAVWLAQQGFEVTLIDVSPVAVDLAAGFARAAGVELVALVRDVEAAGIHRGPWSGILIHHFLDRPSLDAAPGLLTDDGVLIFCQPTLRNLERNPRPAERWLLSEGELASWAAARTDRLEAVLLEEGWSSSGRHEARLVARRTS